jgi:hypothetical protein
MSTRAQTHMWHQNDTTDLVHSFASLLNIGHHPVASGGSGDVYEGTFDGSKVCVKRIRVYSNDGPEKAIKVYHRTSLSLLDIADATTDALPGGCGVETLETQEHRPLLGITPSPLQLVSDWMPAET